MGSGGMGAMGSVGGWVDWLRRSSGEQKIKTSSGVGCGDTGDGRICGRVRGRATGEY